ncbi:MAG: hypothetical protein HN712_10435 [Gemmatimonadetes bacterium]|nr:hypothetical protein [Gemmatimonadota bacterium]MBT6148795.1 hypothetical protein [Gemmatimonadota bacterium]MBT7860721.1 hypothetical protein [Gemmatimonadota bacterium]
MIYGSVAFAIFLLIVVALKYLAPKSTACPDCGQARHENHPLCTSCGWIFDADDDDDNDDEEESEMPWTP